MKIFQLFVSLDSCILLAGIAMDGKPEVRDVIFSFRKLPRFWWRLTEEILGLQ